MAGDHDGGRALRLRSTRGLGARGHGAGYHKRSSLALLLPWRRPAQGIGLYSRTAFCYELQLRGPLPRTRHARTTSCACGPVETVHPVNPPHQRAKGSALPADSHRARRAGCLETGSSGSMGAHGSNHPGLRKPGSNPRVLPNGPSSPRRQTTGPARDDADMPGELYRARPAAAVEVVRIHTRGIVAHPLQRGGSFNRVRRGELARGDTRDRGGQPRRLTKVSGEKFNHERPERACR